MSKNPIANCRKRQTRLNRLAAVAKHLRRQAKLAKKHAREAHFHPLFRT